MPIDAIEEKSISIQSPNFLRISVTLFSLTGAVNAPVRRNARESAHIFNNGRANIAKSTITPPSPTAFLRSIALPATELIASAREPPTTGTEELIANFTPRAARESKLAAAKELIPKIPAKIDIAKARTVLWSFAKSSEASAVTLEL